MDTFLIDAGSVGWNREALKRLNLFWGEADESVRKAVADFIAAVRPENTMALRGTSIWPLVKQYLDGPVGIFIAQYVKKNKMGRCYVDPGFAACVKYELLCASEWTFDNIWCPLQDISPPQVYYSNNNFPLLLPKLNKGYSAKKLKSHESTAHFILADGKSNRSGFWIGTINLLIVLIQMIGEKAAKHEIVTLKNKGGARRFAKIKPPPSGIAYCKICHLPTEASLHWGFDYKNRKRLLQKACQQGMKIIKPTAIFCPLHKKVPNNKLRLHDARLVEIIAKARLFSRQLVEFRVIQLDSEMEVNKFAYGITKIGNLSSWVSVFDFFAAGADGKISPERMSELINSLFKIASLNKAKVFAVASDFLPNLADYELQSLMLAADINDGE